MNEIWQVAVAAGIPSGLIGFLFLVLSKKIDRRDEIQIKELDRLEKERQRREEKIEKELRKREDTKQEHEILMIQCLCASLHLSEATAKAIRDGHTNGEVAEALDIAYKAKEAQKDFLHKQSIINLF